VVEAIKSMQTNGKRQVFFAMAANFLFGHAGHDYTAETLAAASHGAQVSTN
jgi:hypothetical protein